MNRILKKAAAVFLTAVFICTGLSALAAPANVILDQDYRNKTILDRYGNYMYKPTAQFSAHRWKNREMLDSVASYSGHDFNTEFPVLTCYVGDTITFRDLSYDNNEGGSISGWDWQRYGHLGDTHNIYNYNIVNQDSYTLTSPGETTFYLCVKNNLRVKTGCCDPWSENGNHQVVGKNKWFPNGMYWYFTAIKVVVLPVVEAKVHVRYWDAKDSRIFYEDTVNLGELQGDNAQVETSVHVTDWEGYQFYDWLVVLPDNTIQYSGIERDVGIVLASWVPEKYLNVEFFPYKDTEVQVRYWDSTANTIMSEETVYGDKVVREQETSMSIPVKKIDGYDFTKWNVQLPDGTVQYEGTDKEVGIILNGYIPFKYLNIEYVAKGGHNTPSHDNSPTNPNPPNDIPVKPNGVCDGEITWTETDSHQVYTGRNDRYGKKIYTTCSHTFKYKTVLSAEVNISPDTFKSGYGFEAEVTCSVDTALVSNSGCSSWGNSRKPTSTVKNPTRAIVYIPWDMTNRLGTQSKAVSMDNYRTLKFRLPISNVSEAGARKIYTPVELAGSAENPESHSFEIYINGGGVGDIEFCKKLTENITINGDMYSDDFSGMD